MLLTMRGRLAPENDTLQSQQPDTIFVMRKGGVRANQVVPQMTKNSQITGWKAMEGSYYGQ